MDFPPRHISLLMEKTPKMNSTPIIIQTRLMSNLTRISTNTIACWSTKTSKATPFYWERDDIHWQNSRYRVMIHMMAFFVCLCLSTLLHISNFSLLWESLKVLFFRCHNTSWCQAASRPPCLPACLATYLPGIHMHPITQFCWMKTRLPQFVSVTDRRRQEIFQYWSLSS